DPAARSAGDPVPGSLRDRPRRRAAGDHAPPRSGAGDGEGRERRGKGENHGRGGAPPRGPGVTIRPRLGLLLLAVLALVALLGAPLAGSHAISLSDALRGEPTAAAIFWQLRLPRVLLALLAGAGLAVSGL